ncbi:hypothetical protein T484DRAFT_3124053 [Baffinella frigidus]|nr:hypothetical protein T484DRAFT_3124053 [Cryptophyta sp. CCMP2293]
MSEPMTARCPELHSFCRTCYVQWLVRNEGCPTCRHPVAGEQQLVRNRPLEAMILRLTIRCPTAKRAKLAPAAAMTVEEIRTELRGLGLRGLQTAGTKADLVPRLVEERSKNAGCPFMGTVGELRASHLGKCDYEPVACPNEGCAASPLRKDVPAHAAECESAPVKCPNCEDSPLRRDVLAHKAKCDRVKVACTHCEIITERRALAAHQGSCPFAKIECPNAGCGEERTRAGMPVHRAECEHEEVACVLPGCDARKPRKEMLGHLTHSPRHHLPAVVAQTLLIQDSDNAALKRDKVEREAELESVNRAAVGGATKWVFNWRADGWAHDALFKSTVHDFGEGIGGAFCFIRKRCARRSASSTRTTPSSATSNRVRSLTAGSLLPGISSRRRRRRWRRCARTGVSGCT